MRGEIFNAHKGKNNELKEVSTKYQLLLKSFKVLHLRNASVYSVRQAATYYAFTSDCSF